MRSGVVYFRVAAVIFLVGGVIGLVIPDQYIAILDVDASVGGRLWGRAFGGVSVGFGAMLWMIDPSNDHLGRRIGAVGALLAFGLTGLGDVVSLIQGDLPPLGWAFVAFNAVMTGFAIYYLTKPASDSNPHP